MDFNISITPYAQLQLLEILEYYLQSSSTERTEKVEASILGAIRNIQKNPFANKVFENVNQPNQNLRRYMLKSVHLILYEIEGDQINVLDIFDCRRNPEDFKY